MLIIAQEDGLEPLRGSENHRCRLCDKRRATWKGRRKGEGTQVPMCAWCVLYAGSAWGHRFRDEIQARGIMVRQTAVMSGNPKVHVPELDERHRLQPEDAEKLLLGIGFTSTHLRDKLGGLLSILRDEEGVRP